MDNALSYSEISPSPQLRRFINCFWQIHSSSPTRLTDRTFPDGCQEIIFNLGTKVLRQHRGQYYQNADIELVGQMTEPYDLVTDGAQHFWGIKLYPHSLVAFIDESVNDLLDQSISIADIAILKELFISSTVKEREQLDFNAFVEKIESVLTQHLLQQNHNKRTYLLVEQAVTAMYQQQHDLRIDCLVKQLGVSERYLQQLFKYSVGLTPQALHKMIRFQSSFRLLNESKLSLTEVALCCGYFDQAHFSREFKKFSGYTPSAYRKQSLPLNQFFLQDHNSVYMCGH